MEAVFVLFLILAGVSHASFLPLDGQNQCLKAAQDCGLDKKCHDLRSEYVLACIKRGPGGEHCNRQKCHRALRRFLELVPEDFSLGVLFCPCTDTLCGERRRMTIVPSCSYQERDSLQPNCLHLQSYCRREDLCRSRLADFQHNCQPSGLHPSSCARESGAMCLKAYAGLIGTIMTPNYVNNHSMGVSLWCNCDDSGNQLQDCLRIQQMFTNNPCLANSMGSPAPLPVESTPAPPSHSSPLDRKEELSNNALPELNVVEVTEEEEGVEEDDQDEEEYGGQDEAGQFDVSRGSVLAPGPALPLLLPLLLLLAACLRA